MLNPPQPHRSTFTHLRDLTERASAAAPFLQDLGRSINESDEGEGEGVAQTNRISTVRAASVIIRPPRVPNRGRQQLRDGRTTLILGLLSPFDSHSYGRGEDVTEQRVRGGPKGDLGRNCDASRRRRRRFGEQDAAIGVAEATLLAGARYVKCRTKEQGTNEFVSLNLQNR